WWCRAERRYPPRRDAPTGESSPESSPPTSRPPSSSPRTASRGRRWPRTPSAPHGHGTPANNSVQVVSSSRSFQKIEPPNTPGGFSDLFTEPLVIGFGFIACRGVVVFGFFAGFVDFGVEFPDFGVEFLDVGFGRVDVVFEFVFQVAHAGADVAAQGGSDAEQCAQRYPGVQVHDAHPFSVPVFVNGCQHARHAPESGNTPHCGHVDNPRRRPTCG